MDYLGGSTCSFETLFTDDEESVAKKLEAWSAQLFNAKASLNVAHTNKDIAIAVEEVDFQKPKMSKLKLLNKDGFLLLQIQFDMDLKTIGYDQIL